jgi:hypothetical protein
MRIATVVGIATLAVACTAGHRVAADRPPPTTALANTTVATTGVSSAPGVSKPAAPVASSDQAETIDQSLVKRGYRPRRINSQLRYCLSQTLTGTHFSDTVCLSSAQIKANDQNTKQNLDTLNRELRTACPNNSCN